jgi:colanic acid/amylovoran biosynthesis protein
MVREPVSLEFLHRLNLNQPSLYLLPDTAFTFRGVPRPIAENWLHEHGIDLVKKRPLLGLTAINWGAQNRDFKRQSEYEEACAEAIRYFVCDLGGRAILFSQVTGPSDDSDDRIPARRIKAKLPDISDSIVLLEEQLPPELLKTLYGQMDVFIGTRMHSNIFALTEGVPVIAIGYLHKTRGIAAMLKLEKWVVDIQKINSKTLMEKLAVLWQERDTLKAQITSEISSLAEHANHAGLLCAEDFFHLRKP